MSLPEAHELHIVRKGRGCDNPPTNDEELKEARLPCHSESLVAIEILKDMRDKDKEGWKTSDVVGHVPGHWKYFTVYYVVLNKYDGDGKKLVYTLNGKPKIYDIPNVCGAAGVPVAPHQIRVVKTICNDPMIPFTRLYNRLRCPGRRGAAPRVKLRL
tara:strand:+ start:837 stop:1307 length:471 start_codon:yes stop_codon:yes gene_type:complete